MSSGNTSSQWHFDIVETGTMVNTKIDEIELIKLFVEVINNILHLPVYIYTGHVSNQRNTQSVIHTMIC